MSLQLTKQLKNTLWLLVGLLCRHAFQRWNRLYLHPQKFKEPGTSNGCCHPTDFIVMAHCFRRYILVVEPSPEFPHRSLAADCPIFLLFSPSRLPFPAALWGRKLQEVPAIHPVMIQLVAKRDALQSLSQKLKYTLRHLIGLSQHCLRCLRKNRILCLVHHFFRHRANIYFHK